MRGEALLDGALHLSPSLLEWDLRGTGYDPYYRNPDHVLIFQSTMDFGDREARWGLIAPARASWDPSLLPTLERQVTRELLGIGGWLRGRRVREWITLVAPGGLARRWTLARTGRRVVLLAQWGQSNSDGAVWLGSPELIED